MLTRPLRKTMVPSCQQTQLASKLPRNRRNLLPAAERVLRELPEILNSSCWQTSFSSHTPDVSSPNGIPTRYRGLGEHHSRKRLCFSVGSRRGSVRRSTTRRLRETSQDWKYEIRTLSFSLNLNHTSLFFSVLFFKSLMSLDAMRQTCF